MSGRGGWRPNSGRRPNAEKYQAPILEAEARIVEGLPDLVALQFELARGVTVQEPMPNGGTRVYARPPDRGAIEYLLNRIMGKPTERHENELAGLSDAELIALIQPIRLVEVVRPDGVEGVEDDDGAGDSWPPSAGGNGHFDAGDPIG